MKSKQPDAMVEILTAMNREKRNFYKVADALIYAGNVLEKYTEDGLKLLHEKICSRIPGHLRRCNSRCSQKFGKDVKRYMYNISFKIKKKLFDVMHFILLHTQKIFCLFEFYINLVTINISMPRHVSLRSRKAISQ